MLHLHSSQCRLCHLLIVSSITRAVTLGSGARFRETAARPSHIAETIGLMSSSSEAEEMSLPEKSYCYAARGHEWHGPYHDTQYGFPIQNDDNALFERLVLEINQAGLSWLTILKKQENFKRAYDGFDVRKVAFYDEAECERLRQDAGIIRNRLKINAAVFNAQRIVEMQKTHGSFQAWLDSHHPLSKPEWVALFKKTFKFAGGEITAEFLWSLGYLPGAHVQSCPVCEEISNLELPWMSAPEDFDWDDE